MSKSIADLMGSLMNNNNIQGVTQPSPEGELYNPDVPNTPDTIAGNIRNRKIIQDKYYNDMKLTRYPRNGSGYYFGKNNGRLANMDPREDAFLMDGSIDPNNIRRKTDPANALPNTFASGSLLDKYQLPKETFKPSNNVSLVQQSRMSYQNYKNRFAEIPQVRTI
jgi:hypothetical protein